MTRRKSLAVPSAAQARHLRGLLSFSIWRYGGHDSSPSWRSLDSRFPDKPESFEGELLKPGHGPSKPPRESTVHGLTDRGWAEARYCGSRYGQDRDVRITDEGRAALGRYDDKHGPPDGRKNVKIGPQEWNAENVDCSPVADAVLMLVTALAPADSALEDGRRLAGAEKWGHAQMVAMTDAQAEAYDAAQKAIVSALADAYAAGRKDGRAMLSGLASGSLSYADFNRVEAPK